MFKRISITNIGKDNNSRSRQLNKELLESRLRLNSHKKAPFMPFSITENKSIEKIDSLSINSKDLSFKKNFKVQKRSINNKEKRLTDISNDSIKKFNPNLRKLSNKKIDVTNSLYMKNPKTANNSLINKRLTTSNFINNNRSTIRTYGDKNLNQNKKKEIKIQKKSYDIKQKIKSNIIKKNNANSNNNYKRSGLLSLNLNISNFNNKLMKNNNKSSIIKTNFNNSYNNKSRNIKNLNQKNKVYLNKKISQKNTLNKNKDSSLNYTKDKTFNGFNQFSKTKYLFLKSYNKYLQFQSLYNTNQNNKKIYLKSSNENKNKNKKKNNDLEVNNANINNFINCNINYIINLNNNKKFKKDIKNKNMNLTYKNNDINNKLFYKGNIDKYDNKKKIFEKINLKYESNKLDKIKELDYKVNDDNNSDSIYENDIKEISKNDFEDSKEESGLLSFDKIEDLIVYHNMKDINKKDNYLFFIEDRKIFNYKYAILLCKNLLNTS